MKELSIEDKAARYDKAIEVAKRNYDTIVEMDENCTFAKSGIINTFHRMFPELKGSEGERIRKAISYAIGNSIHEDGTLINGVTESEAMDWLEKQGEQNPTLKDRVQPQWKPSDEQLRILLNASNGNYMSDYYRSVLSELYRNIKQL